MTTDRRLLTPKVVAQLSGPHVDALEADFDLVGHSGQQPPEGDWRTWLILGGRGGGKTRAGAQWVEDQARTVGRIALVGQSLHDVREVMVDGPSGLRGLRRLNPSPRWEASRRRLVWPSGAVAQAFSAEDPDSLRGPQFGAAWADEWCAWRKPAETLALLRMGLRLGERPRLVITTTPKPTRALRILMAEAGVARTDLPTRENAAHLAPDFLSDLNALYGGTRLAAQELEGRVVEPDGGLFPYAMLQAAREAAPARLDQTVVGVDPPATKGGAACGIVVAGRAGDTAWVLGDRTVGGRTPQGWAEAVRLAVEEFGADRVIAEVNQGGDMVEAVLRTAGVSCPVRRATARIGKAARAEPVAALYEQGRVRHAAAMPELEDELMGMGVDGGASPDRADALVWAVTDLLLNRREGPRVGVV